MVLRRRRRRRPTMLQAALNARHPIFTVAPGSAPTPAFTLIPITDSTLPGQVDHEPASPLRSTVAGRTWEACLRSRVGIFCEQQRLTYVVEIGPSTRSATVCIIIRQ